MSLKNAVGGVLLIAGTTIGAGILALPADTAHLGFTLSCFYFFTCWFFLTLGALYVLEANLQVGFGSNLISMAKATLGKPGQVVTWFMYLLLLYCILSAYLTGSGAWLNKGFFYAGLQLPLPVCALIAALLTSIFLVLGTHLIDLTNRVLMVFLAGAFVTLIVIALPHTQSELLFQQPTTFDLKSMPLIVTAFGYAIIVPTLTEYLHGHAKQLRNVILIGSLAPLLLYIIWELTTLGIIPLEGPQGLLAINQAGHPATDIPDGLAHVTGHYWLTNASKVFSIFAIVTSLLGVSLSLFDFLADGFQIQKNMRSKLALCGITFLPPLAFVTLYPSGFAHALRFGGFYVSFILGFLPALMVWRGRYHSDMPSAMRVFGGKPLLLITMAFFIAVMVIEMMIVFNLL